MLPSRMGMLYLSDRRFKTGSKCLEMNNVLVSWIRNYALRRDGVLRYSSLVGAPVSWLGNVGKWHAVESLRGLEQ